MSTRPANCCQHIPPYRFLDGFPDPSQFAAAKLTHYSSKLQRPSDSSRPRQRLLLSGYVHPNPGPTTKYPCPVCVVNLTSRGVSYLCNRCSGWVHSKSSGLQTQQSIDELKTGQFNAELGEFLERHNMKVAVIQESKLSSNYRTPIIQNFTTVRKDRSQGQGGDLLTLIHKSINFYRRPESPETEHHLEELTITGRLGDAELIITNVFIPQALA